METLTTLSLGGSRLRIRPITADDLPDLFEIYSDPEVMRFASDPPFSAFSIMEQFYTSVQAGYASGEYYELAIETDHTVVGTCSLHGFDHIQKQVEIGYLLNRKYWRQGIMNEALTLLISQLFSHFQFDTIVADVDIDNIPSRALVMKLGFVPIEDSDTYFILSYETWHKM